MRPGDLVRINNDAPDDDPDIWGEEALVLYLYPEPNLTGDALCAWVDPGMGLLLGTSVQKMGPDCLPWTSCCILLGDVVGWIHSIDAKVVP